MQEHVCDDDRFEFLHVDARNLLYNPRGTVLPSHTLSARGVVGCDAVCMHSVITHQDPDEARITFGLLRPTVVNAGRLHFTAFVDDAIDSYVEADPEQPRHMSTYHPDALVDLVEREGWRVDEIHPKTLGVLEQTSFVCTRHLTESRCSAAGWPHIERSSEVGLLTQRIVLQGAQPGVGGGPKRNS